MPVSSATIFCPYGILAPIGACGMEEVYHTLDSRLNRDVAIKVPAAQFSERPKVIALLNHPNMCQLLRRGSEIIC
jgi:serine/threonine protein kinase